MKMNRSRDKHYTTILPQELISRLKANARKNRIQQKQIVISALSDFLNPPERSEDALLQRLSRIEGKQRSIGNKLEILSETLALFIQVWFANTYELPDKDKALATAQGEKRFGKFVETLQKRLRDDQGSALEE